MYGPPMAMAMGLLIAIAVRWNMGQVLHQDHMIRTHDHRQLNDRCVIQEYGEISVSDVRQTLFIRVRPPGG